MESRIFLDGRVTLHLGDCLEVLDQMPANSVDTVITDPPYHFDTIVERFGKDGSAPAQFGSDGVFARASAGFMGKDWDGGDIAFRPETWAKVLRVLKPGGHLAAFSAPKCVHKMAFGIETAGFEVRDRIINLIDPDEHVIAFLDSLSPAQADALFRLTDHFGALGEAFWIFGTGFPKNHDVAKGIDKLLGATREKVRTTAGLGNPPNLVGGVDKGGDRPWRQEAIDRGYHEKDGEIPASPEAERWAGWGTALKPAYEPIVIARKPLAESSVARQVLATGTGAININAARVATDDEIAATRNVALGSSASGVYGGADLPGEYVQKDGGRWPANLAHDGSAAVLAGFPDVGPSSPSAAAPASYKPNGKNEVYGQGMGSGFHPGFVDSSGSASRFFYSSKADAHDRIGSGHPTVKPIDTMQWLCRMLCPPGGTILDLFAGTGTTGEAAYREGFNAILIEREPEYQADIARRMEHATAGPVARRHAATRAKADRQAKAGSAAPSPTASIMDDIFAPARGNE